MSSQEVLRSLVSQRPHAPVTQQLEHGQLLAYLIMQLAGNIPAFFFLHPQ